MYVSISPELKRPFCRTNRLVRHTCLTKLLLATRIFARQNKTDREKTQNKWSRPFDFLLLAPKRPRSGHQEPHLLWFDLSGLCCAHVIASGKQEIIVSVLVQAICFGVDWFWKRLPGHFDSPVARFCFDIQNTAKGKLSFISYCLVLPQWSQAPSVQHTHDGRKTNHCAPSHCKKTWCCKCSGWKGWICPMAARALFLFKTHRRSLPHWRGPKKVSFSVGPARVYLNSWTGETPEKQKPWPSRFPYIVARLCIMWVGFYFSKPDALSLKVGKAQTCKNISD